MSELSLSKNKIRVLLLEGIHETAEARFREQGYENVTCLSRALDAAEIKEALADVHVLGIRSRTKLPAGIFAEASRLLAVGCFCIGTNQVALDSAKMAGVPVFNAPYSNTRSVAELVMAEIILLLRRAPEKIYAAREGAWRKTATGAREIRGKTLGIVGYGHIGSQLSILAESLGMRVLYYDIADRLPIGNAQRCATMDDLFDRADVVSLHVPETDLTRRMVDSRLLARMPRGSCLVNASRGSVVDLPALEAALDADHLGGVAVDVFPEEPSSGHDPFVTPLQRFDNVLLTPHVGGATEEAQENIGREVADKLVRYSDNGSTEGAVNFVGVTLPRQAGHITRFLHIHRDAPGVLSRINDVFSARDINIAGQYLRTDGEVGYVVMDVKGDIKAGQGIRRALEEIEGTLRVRFLL